MDFWQIRLEVAASGCYLYDVIVEVTTGLVVRGAVAK